MTHAERIRLSIAATAAQRARRAADALARRRAETARFTRLLRCWNTDRSPLWRRALATRGGAT